MIEQVGDSLPAIFSTAIAMIVMALVTLYVARKSGVTDLQQAVGRESDRLIMAQSKRIKLLEEEVERLKAEGVKKDELIEKLTARIDALEKVVSDEQITILRLQKSDD